MSSPVTLVIFEGGPITSPLEEKFRQVRMGVVMDQILKAKAAGIVHIIVATPYKDLACKVRDLGVQVELDDNRLQPFHFGKRLVKIIAQGNLSKVLYMGGAAAPLISSVEIENIRKLIEGQERVVTANNYFSSDIVGFSPASTLQHIGLPRLDNSLAWLLVNEGSLPFLSLPRSLGLHFDLDTPGDLLALGTHPYVGGHTENALRKLDLDLSAAYQIQAAIGDMYQELVVFGRVNAAFFGYLDEHTKCRIRLFSEERGMKALGRDVKGEVVSVIGKLVEELGYHGFFNFLASLASGAVLDTRILFAHFGWELSQQERFNSDWGLLEEITHPGLREFTAAAFSAPIPVLLGGHSLVTGGLWALVDGSIRQREED